MGKHKIYPLFCNRVDSSLIISSHFCAKSRSFRDRNASEYCLAGSFNPPDQYSLESCSVSDLLAKMNQKKDCSFWSLKSFADEQISAAASPRSFVAYSSLALLSIVKPLSFSYAGIQIKYCRENRLKTDTNSGITGDILLNLNYFTINNISVYCLFY